MVVDAWNGGGVMDLGLHDGLSFADYAAIPLPNSSAISWGMTSMLHMKACVDHLLPDKDTTDRKFGRGAHCMILEPDLFQSRFLIAEKCRMVLASGQRKGQQCGNPGIAMTPDEIWVCGQHAKGDVSRPVDYVSAEEYERLQKMRDSLHNHPAIGMLRRPGWSELTIVFEHLGVRCKARLDRATDSGPLVLDLKKCGVGGGSREAVENSIKGYGWHRQLCLYLYAYASVSGKMPDGAWVVVEDDDPYDVNVLPIDNQTMSIAEKEIEDVLTRWKRATETGVFHGYISDPKDIQRGGLPPSYKAWKLREQEQAA